MKKIYLVLSLLLFGSLIFAQEDANFYKNEGNNAYKSKDYEGAFNAYAKALELLEAEGTVDEALNYNTGYCAYKAEKYDDAIPYFTKSMEQGYKESKPFQMVAVIQYKLSDIDGMIKTCNEGLEKYNDDAKLKGYAAKAYLKKGLVFYNEGNAIKKAANESGLNKTDAEAFKAEYAKADEQYKQALPFIEKAYSMDPESSSVLQALKNVYISLDMNDKADAL